MFEKQWWYEANKEWAFRASYDSLTQALRLAQTDAYLNSSAYRVVEQPTGRVVAVFGSSGKRLTFPIATAIAYAALAQAVALASPSKLPSLASASSKTRCLPDGWPTCLTAVSQYHRPDSLRAETTGGATMMNEEQAIELGKRAVAAGFRPMPGMRDLYDWRAVHVGASSGNVLRVSTGDHGELLWREDATWHIPDFRDPATLGILRAQVIALVPRAVELGFNSWQIPPRPEVRQMYWVNDESLICKVLELAHPYADNWHIESLVAALEAAKAGEL